MAATTVGVIDRSAPASARVSFREPASEKGFLDAGWWPRSRDLKIELPALLDAVWLAGHDVMRISYGLDFWDPAPRRLQIGDRVVRLGGFHTQIPGLLTLIDAWGRDPVNVLVVPPETAASVADRALALVAAGPGADRPDQVLHNAQGPAGRL
jgi:uncharacterized protein DUF5994